MPRPEEHVVMLTAGDLVLLSRVVSRGTHPARMIGNPLEPPGSTVHRHPGVLGAGVVLSEARVGPRNRGIA